MLVIHPYHRCWQTQQVVRWGILYVHLQSVGYGFSSSSYSGDDRREARHQIMETFHLQRAIGRLLSLLNKHRILNLQGQMDFTKLLFCGRNLSCRSGSSRKPGNKEIHIIWYVSSRFSNTQRLWPQEGGRANIQIRISNGILMTYSFFTSLVTINASIRIALALDAELHFRSNKLFGLFFRSSLYARWYNGVSSWKQKFGLNIQNQVALPACIIGQEGIQCGTGTRRFRGL